MTYKMTLAEKTLEQVPAISNLRTIVAQYVAEKG